MLPIFFVRWGEVFRFMEFLKIFFERNTVTRTPLYFILITTHIYLTSFPLSTHHPPYISPIPFSPSVHLSILFLPTFPSLSPPHLTLFPIPTSFHRFISSPSFPPFYHIPHTFHLLIFHLFSPYSHLTNHHTYTLISYHSSPLTRLNISLFHSTLYSLYFPNTFHLF